MGRLVNTLHDPTAIHYYKRKRKEKKIARKEKGEEKTGNKKTPWENFNDSPI